MPQEQPSRFSGLEQSFDSLVLYFLSISGQAKGLGHRLGHHQSRWQGDEQVASRALALEQGFPLECACARPGELVKYTSRIRRSGA